MSVGLCYFFIFKIILKGEGVSKPHVPVALPWLLGMDCWYRYIYHISLYYSFGFYRHFTRLLHTHVLHVFKCIYTFWKKKNKFVNICMRWDISIHVHIIFQMDCRSWIIKLKTIWGSVNASCKFAFYFIK